MTSPYNEIESELAEKVVQLFERQGFNPTLMRIYIILFLSTKPLGLKDVASKSGYSISTVCNTMEILEETMDIRKFKNPGSKKIFYECAHDMIQIHKKKMAAAKKEAESMTQILKEAEAMLKEAAGPEAAIRLDHIIKLRESYERFHDMFHNFDNMIEGIKR
jgi:DNA-binding transcriptional regulator GbsR (MarR family)